MKNSDQFKETLHILIQAYLNDELTKGNCNACAVGNIVKYQMQKTGYEHDPLEDGLATHGKWRYLFYTNSEEGKQFVISPHNLFIFNFILYLSNFDAQNCITVSGYSQKDLMKIEFAFEMASEEGDKEFNGLMAVIDILYEIHEVTDPVYKNEFKRALLAKV